MRSAVDGELLEHVFEALASVAGLLCVEVGIWWW